MGDVILGPKMAAEVVCHDEQLRIWTDDHVLAALSMSGFLREGLSYDDVIELHGIVAREIKSIIQSAFDHPEAKTIRRSP